MSYEEISTNVDNLDELFDESFNTYSSQSNKTESIDTKVTNIQYPLEGQAFKELSILNDSSFSLPKNSKMEIVKCADENKHVFKINTNENTDEKNYFCKVVPSRSLKNKQTIENESSFKKAKEEYNKSNPDNKLKGTYKIASLHNFSVEIPSKYKARKSDKKSYTVIVSNDLDKRGYVTFNNFIKNINDTNTKMKKMKEVVKRVSEIEEELFRKLLGLQGDLNENNIMVKTNKNGEIEKVKLIDFGRFTKVGKITKDNVRDFQNRLNLRYIDYGIRMIEKDKQQQFKKELLETRNAELSQEFKNFQNAVNGFREPELETGKNGISMSTNNPS